MQIASVISDPGLLNSQRKYIRIHLVGILNVVTRLNRSIYRNEPTQTHVETHFDWKQAQFRFYCNHELHRALFIRLWNDSFQNTDSAFSQNLKLALKQMKQIESIWFPKSMDSIFYQNVLSNLQFRFIVGCTNKLCIVFHLSAYLFQSLHNNCTIVMRVHTVRDFPSSASSRIEMIDKFQSKCFWTEGYETSKNLRRIIPPCNYRWFMIGRRGAIESRQILLPEYDERKISL